MRTRTKYYLSDSFEDKTLWAETYLRSMIQGFNAEHGTDLFYNTGYVYYYSTVVMTKNGKQYDRYVGWTPLFLSLASQEQIVIDVKVIFEDAIKLLLR
jgi:hypothetical protein